MREYLFELREKANKTLADIEKTLCKYGVNTRYSLIEQGFVWKDLSGNRAYILAEALETTPEYILMCEAESGGYDRRCLISERGREYDAPLTSDEKAFAQEYISFAEKKISAFRKVKFKGALGNLMCYEDFYDIGMLAFLRAVKKIFAKMKRDPDSIKVIECPDAFFKHFFSQAIGSAYRSYIDRELALKRKDYHHAVRLDSAIKENDETEYYEVTPSYAIPVSKQVESACYLETLYRYLSDRQIYSCKLLISDWAPKEIISAGYASRIDIGIIKFYILQIQKYGKILWKAEDYISSEQNVTYDFGINKWHVQLSYKTKLYCLGNYTDLSTALDLHALTYYHIAIEDFLEWYEAHIKRNSRGVMAFTYPLPCDNDIDINSLPLPLKKPWSKKEIGKATKDNPVGICFNPTANTYQVCIQQYYLGTYNSFEKALDVRKSAENHYTAGDFVEWHSNLKTILAKARITYAILEKAPNNRYQVKRNYLRKLTRLGVYDKQEALEVKALADSHIDKGDFDEWAKAFYAEYQEKHRRCTYARIRCRTRKNGALSYTVDRAYRRVTTVLGYYATNEEAQRIKVLADSHIDMGDFDEWAEKFRSERKANKKKKSSSCVPELAFTAAYAICKYLCGIYNLICYDTCGSEHLVCETADVEEAYKTMDLANEHIEAGDFNAWFADYKKY